LRNTLVGAPQWLARICGCPCMIGGWNYFLTFAILFGSLFQKKKEREEKKEEKRKQKKKKRKKPHVNKRLAKGLPFGKKKKKGGYNPPSMRLIVGIKVTIVCCCGDGCNCSLLT